MRLWTVQPFEVYEKLQNDKVFRCDIQKSNVYDSVSDAYAWMTEQMETRIESKPVGVEYPVWAWHTLDWKHKKPDLRTAEFRGYKGRQACIEIEISDDEVLLSDFDSWHHVLNDSYLDNSKTEAEWTENQEQFDSLPEADKNKIKEQSWERIFDIEPFENEWTWNGRYVQAVFWELRLEQIVDVRFFGYHRNS